MPGVKGLRQHVFTEEQVEWLAGHAPGRPWAEVARLFNDRFGTSLSQASIWSAAKYRNISNGRNGRFAQGNEPWNRGRKGVNGGSATRFKPGNRPHNAVAVGAERDNDGYLEVKVAEPHVWRSKAALTWERHHGRPVPPSHCVLFADGDRRNFASTNLLLVSRAELAVMNKRGLVTAGFGEGTRVGQLIALVVLARRRRQRKRKGPCGPVADSSTAQQLQA